MLPFNMTPGGQATYQIPNSVRLRASASAYFSRTFGTPTSGKAWSYSLWCKRGALSSQHALLCAFLNASNYGILYFDATTNGLIWIETVAAATVASVATNAVFRDPSAHYHIEIIYDADNATASNRAQIWVNGIRQTFSGSPTYPGSGVASYTNTAVVHNIGRNINGPSGYLDGYLSDAYFIDGQALTPSSFAQQDTNGVWVPKAYTGTYGTNGFHLEFKDTSALTAAAFGKDTGTIDGVHTAANNWTPQGSMSLTAGVTYDSIVDTPTNNFCTMSPIDKFSGETITNGNLTLNQNHATIGGSKGSIGMTTGKWRWEATVSALSNGAQGYGIVQSKWLGTPSPASGEQGFYYDGIGPGYAYANGTLLSSSVGGMSAGDVLSFEFDADAGSLVVKKNNAALYTFNSIPAGTYLPMSESSSSIACGADLSFGQGVLNASATWYSAAGGYFKYAPTTGFKALCTANLPAVAIAKPALHFDVKTHTGNGTSQSITGAAFTPDFVWIKSRSNIEDNILSNVLSGTTKYLVSNTTASEVTDAQAVTSFNSDGFSVGSFNQINFNAATYVDWLWKANGAGVSNTSGSITSTVSANTTAGFSIVAYTGTGANATVGHGLLKAPELVICKNRTSGPVVYNWPIYHQNQNATPQNGSLYLDVTNAYAVNASFWNNTAPTSTTIALGSGVQVNAAADNIVAYCFHSVDGYSKIGSYVGNGSADGPFVYCGFRPKYVMIKNASISSNWYVWDTARGVYNASTPELYPNLTSAEGGSGDLDITANGFKLRNSADAGINGSTNTIIFAAFAEFPFGGSNVSPSPAR